MNCGAANGRGGGTAREISRMRSAEPTRSPWYRLERRITSNDLEDYVEVGACSHCGRGVDRAFPPEYRIIDEQLLCVACALPDVSRSARHPHQAGHSTGQRE